MKAIQVNPGTLDKIRKELCPEMLEVVKQRYDAIVHHDEEEIYILVDELTGTQENKGLMTSGKNFFSNFILMTGYGEGGWKGWSHYPDEWFEVRRKK